MPTGGPRHENPHPHPHRPPPPAIPGLRGLVSVLALAAIFLIAAPPAEAQTAGTLTIAATGSGGDRDSTATGLQVDEGDTITVTATAHGKTAGRVRVQVGVTGTASSSDRVGDFDVSILGGLILIGADTTQASETFRVNDDSHREGDETVIFTISGFEAIDSPVPSTWSIGSPSSVTVTIRASDQADR
ncbi:MAG: hypothetical protein OXU41_02515, partial [Gammaproteobacteria bacterium]|nr:hypothetical protein [Gammaproteobacteria bacterium]